jgi:uncharacterized metal-binding protein YceD (DUF177 family)
MTAAPTPEFSRPVSVARLGSDSASYQIAANPREAAALAIRFGIPAVHSLEATVNLQRRPGGDIAFMADLRAAVTQSCVVTLAPLDVTIAEPFTLVFRAGIDEDEADRIALEDLEDEIVEPLVDDVIDIGEVVAQQLALALDPYPRSPDLPTEGEGLVLGDGDRAAAPKPDSPFAALKRLGKS